MGTSSVLVSRANTAVLGMKILHHSCKPRRYVPLRAGDDFKEGDFTSLDDFLYSRGVMFVGDGQAEAAAERIKGAKNGTYLFAPTSSVEKTNFPINGDPMNAMDLSASDKRATKKKIIKIPFVAIRGSTFPGSKELLFIYEMRFRSLMNDVQHSQLLEDVSCQKTTKLGVLELYAK